MNVDPLSLGDTPERPFRLMFRASVSETVTRSTTIDATGAVLKWGTWSLDTDAKTLTKGPETWALDEVVYVLADDNTAPDFVVLIFRIEARRVAVRVSPSTFRGKLSQSPAWGAVLFSTIDSSRGVKKPVLDEGFPRLALGFDSAAFGARANTGISGFTSHVVERANGSRQLYCAIGKQKEYLGTKADADAPRRLVLEGTVASDYLKPHETIAEEIELSDDGACFVSSQFKFCPATGKMTRDSREYDLAEALYVADGDQWACVLHFRQKTAQPFAVRLAHASALMLLIIKPKMLDVLTSTTIRGVPVSWQNAHGQGTTDAPVSRSIAAEHAGLMLDTRARMVYVPSAPKPIVVRYEPLPKCTDYADATKGWSVWDLCASDAAARAPSEACAVFASCAKGEEVASLVSLVQGGRVTVALYDAPELGLLYGVTPNASYLVKPNGSVAKVIVAMGRKSEVREATLEGKVWTCVDAEPPCKRLIECMKGAELEGCKAHAEACAWTEDRSVAATRLEHEGVVVNMRQLDLYTHYGVDARGAFALSGSDVLFVPGVKRPPWPRESVTVGNEGKAQVFRAGYSMEKSRWVVGMTDPVPWSPWLLILVICLIGFGLMALVYLVSYFNRQHSRARRYKKRF
jgi:hypothetical protein